MAHDPHIADGGAAALRPPRENIFARPGAAPVFHEQRHSATAWARASRVTGVLTALVAVLGALAVVATRSHPTPPDTEHAPLPTRRAQPKPAEVTTQLEPPAGGSGRDKSRRHHEPMRHHAPRARRPHRPAPRRAVRPPAPQPPSVPITPVPAPAPVRPTPRRPVPAAVPKGSPPEFM